MHAGLRRGAALILLAAAPSPAVATNVVSGHVTANGTGVQGVAIAAEWRGSGKHTLPEGTDATGAFNVEMPADLGGSKSLTLSFSKSGYRGQTHNIFITLEGKPLPPTIAVNLVSNNEPQAEDFAALAKEKSHEGRTLFFIPYALSTEKQGDDSSRLNDNLPAHIKWGIVSHLSTIYPRSISVAAIDPGISVTNTEKIRSLGDYLNALAIVTGRGGLRSDTANRPIVDIFSEFVLPAGVADRLPGDTYVEDHIPEAELTNPKLDATLNEAWAHKTLLALADKELHSPNPDRAAIVKYLTAAKGQAANDEELREIESLIAAAGRVQ